MMTRFDVPLGGILRIPVSTYNSSGASVTLSGLSVEDVRIFKDGALEERGPDSGYTVFTDFDSRTGLHIIEVDTSQNDSPSGFWADGSEYNVAIDAITVDSQTVRAWVAWFRLVATTDVSDIHSLVTKVYSDTAVIETVTSDIQSDTNVMVPVVSDIRSQTTRIHSDTITLASDLAEGDFSDILSRLTVTNSNVLIIKSDVSDVLSRAVVINSETTDIQSETEVIQSQVVAIRALASDIQSDTNVMVPILSDVQSDTNILVTTLTTAGTVFEMLSDVYSDTTAINSDTTVIESVTSDIQSDTSDIQSKLVVAQSRILIIKSDTSDVISALVKVYSDTTVISSDTAVIEAADNVWDEAIDGAVTARQLMRLYASALGGKASGLATATAVYRDLADSKDRITATVDADGNRTAVTRDLT
jgi:hypothetical protein